MPVPAPVTQAIFPSIDCIAFLQFFIRKRGKFFQRPCARVSSLLNQLTLYRIFNLIQQIEIAHGNHGGKLGPFGG
jgi:hypothetical protein